MFVTKDATGVGMFLLFVSYFQGVLSFKRKEGVHVTYESEAWSNALNHMIRLGSRFFGVLTDVIVNEDINPTDSTSITDRERNRKMSLLNFSTYIPATKLQKLPMLEKNNYVSSDLYKDIYYEQGKNSQVLYARTAVSQSMVTLSSWVIRSKFVPLVRILETPIGKYTVFMFDVAKEEVSIYYPLNTFIAMLIHQHEGKLDLNRRKRRHNSTLNGLFPTKPKEAFKSQRVFTKAALANLKPKTYTKSLRWKSWGQHGSTPNFTRNSTANCSLYCTSITWLVGSKWSWVICTGSSFCRTTILRDF